jgi:HSP20 family protein
MASKSILPWRRENRNAIQQKDEDPIYNLQTEMNRLFDEFFTEPFGTGLLRMPGFTGGNFVPRVDMSETDQEIKVVAEIPGLDEKDIQLSLNNNILTISGQKESESEEKNRQYHRIERSFGSFRRDISLPADVNDENIDASFKNGVLTIVMEKKPESQGKRIRVTKQN